MELGSIDERVKCMFESLCNAHQSACEFTELIDAFFMRTYGIFT
jgi:hypothetical protein